MTKTLIFCAVFMMLLSQQSHWKRVHPGELGSWDE